MNPKNAMILTQKFMTTIRRIVMKHELFTGDQLPKDIVVYTTDSKKTTLDKMIDPNKLTVLNFGSCSCPIYMERSAKFYEMTAKYANNDNIEFVSCYVPEAHPIDEWKIDSNKRQLLQQKTIQERIEALGYLIVDIEEKVNEESTEKWNSKYITWIADNINEPNLDYYFNARPIRMVVVKNNTVIYKDGYGPWFYNVDAIDEYIANYTKKD